MPLLQRLVSEQQIVAISGLPCDSSVRQVFYLLFTGNPRRQALDTIY